MGVPTNSLLNLKGIVLEKKENSTSTTSTTTNSSNNTSNNGSLLCTTQWAKQRQIRRKQKHMRKSKRVLMMKRNRSSTFRRRDENGVVERKVQILQRLIPSSNPEPHHQGLDGLFRDTASYIISLQMRVRVMQLMVNVLESSQDYYE